MNERRELKWEDVEPGCVLRFVARHILLVVLAVMIGAFTVRAAVNLAYAPEYSSSVTFAVTSKSGLSSSSVNLSAANEMSTIFSSILESNLMAKRICEDLGVSALPGTLSAKTLGETNMLVVKAAAPSPRQAFLMVQSVKNHYTEFSELIDRNAVLQIMSDAQVSTAPLNPINVTRAARLGALVCGLAMIALLSVSSIARDTVQTKSGARHKLDSTSLVSVPHVKKRGKSSPLLISEPGVSFFFEETFFRLRSAVEASIERLDAAGKLPEGGKVILVTSVSAGEGKSTVAANLALALARKHKSVLLIDADLRSPTQVKLFGKGSVSGAGLSGLLQGPTPDLDQISQTATFFRDENIALLLNETPAANAPGLLSSANMVTLLQLMRENMDYIVIDSPPISMFADSNRIADLVDVSLLVVRQDVAAAPDINDAIDALSQSKSRLLGLVLNDMRHLLRRPEKSGYGYGYGYGYGKKQGYGYGYGDKGRRDSHGAE